MKKIKTLTALISASLAPNLDANENTTIVNAMLDTSNENSISNISVLNRSVSYRLAGHRSHSSHRSHRSHRSSSGGGYSRPTYTAPAPVYTAPKRKTTPTYGVYDPLGQQARPSKSYPSKNKKPKKTNGDIKNIVMQVQLALLLEGMYKGKVDGVMGPSTRKAIKVFKKKNNIKSKALLGAQTLNALGVKGF
ncbi:MAG: His-Xaa-Ser repeat protein HxsA [Sulfurovum sp.]|nr:His-Xaa-Ser repeat protein HxsA [Sulfurovum sp.]MCB4764137.1 His-Xaa-Ser repeat protein HxsA [Sulfurovum sp.]MCB4766512.1 His-Xaa-Ser repeat protein HxsA [Sulfurovum sp.]MCB4773279.1 His-Xaa-Ser repeat protein HxsA [Sulfurovum sp.]MCB4774001.1 His-Xaa-Ser repeat protein HxsA [Sulfurovum sp.]